MIKKNLAIMILWSFSAILLLGALPVDSQIEKIDAGTSRYLKIASGDLSDFIEKAINVFLGLASIIALIFLIYGGIKYIVSGGDQQAAQSAKNTILYAIIGLVVIGLSFVIVKFVLDVINPPP